MTNDKYYGFTKAVHERAEQITENEILFNQSSLIFNFLRLPEILHPYVNDQYDGMLVNRFNEQDHEQEWSRCSRFFNLIATVHCGSCRD